MNKTDLQLKQDIDEELLWDPKINAAQIAVSVNQGAVSLKGEVDTFAAKWAAGDATKRVAGVRTVAEDLTVNVLGHHQHADSEIAEAAQAALRWDVWIPKGVTAKVREGWLTLEGKVKWNYERESAARAVRYLMGVVGVTNSITIEQDASTREVKERVQAALQRQASADAHTIDVATTGGTVTLSGNAASWHAIEDATNAAWAAPGVTNVIDTIRMTPDFMPSKRAG